MAFQKLPLEKAQKLQQDWCMNQSTAVYRRCLQLLNQQVNMVYMCTHSGLPSQVKLYGHSFSSTHRVNCGRQFTTIHSSRNGQPYFWPSKPGSIYHLNCVSISLCKQRRGGAPNQKNTFYAHILHLEPIVYKCKFFTL